MKKWLKRILYIFCVLVFVFGIAFYAFYTRFVVKAPIKEYPITQNIKDAQLQDLDYLSLYIDLDKSFDTEIKEQAFIKEIETVKQKLPLMEAEFEMTIAKIMAIADNTHTNINPVSRARRLNAVPLRFYWFEEGLYVVVAKSKYQYLLGKKITKINGYDPNELLSKLKPWYGGSKYRLKFFSPLYFMSPALLNAIGLGLDSNKLTLEYLDTEKKRIAKTISATDAAKENINFWPPRWLNPTQMALKNNWVSLSTDYGIPVPYKHLNKNVWHQFINDELYIKLNENANTETQNTRSYLESVLNEVKHKDLAFVILDLRFNPGGDYNMARSFIKEMNKRLSQQEPFYIITGNGTFSAGLITAAIAKHTLGNKAKILGEPVGDRLQFWADGGSLMRLPNSKITLRIWTAYHDWQNGCNDWSKCFWITIFDGVSVDNLNPNEFIPLKFSDYINGDDSVLKFILSR